MVMHIIYISGIYMHSFMMTPQMYTSHHLPLDILPFFNSVYIKILCHSVSLSYDVPTDSMTVIMQCHYSDCCNRTNMQSHDHAMSQWCKVTVMECHNMHYHKYRYMMSQFCNFKMIWCHNDAMTERCNVMLIVQSRLSYPGFCITHIAFIMIDRDILDDRSKLKREGDEIEVESSIKKVESCPAFLDTVSDQRRKQHLQKHRYVQKGNPHNSSCT